MLVHTGDWDLPHYLDLENLLAWLKKVSQKYTYVLIIAGNHDKVFQDNLEEIKESFKDTNIFFLDNEALTLFGTKFYGSSFSPTYGNIFYAFSETEKILGDKVWSKIPKDTDILLTHTPPFGLCDGYFGSYTLEKVLNSLVNLKLHLFGHIHIGYGYKEKNGKVFVNSSVVGDDLKGPYLPTEIVFDTLLRKVIKVTQTLMDVT